MRARILFLFVVWLATPFVTAAAGQTAGTITGTLADPNGGVLPGVSVTVRNTATGLSRTVVSGAAGRFVVAGVPPGTYELRAELAGFKPHVRQGVAVAVAATVNLNITLQLGDLAMEDVVVGATPLVNTSTSELSYLVGAEAIERLPLNGRNYTDLALLQPGANTFSGTAFEYHCNDALDSKNFFDTGAKPDFRRNQFGGTLGGPIAADRVFFFAGYEGLVERLGKNVSTVVPDDNARLGILPAGAVVTSPAVASYLAEFPRANGPLLGQGLATHTFPFNQTLDQHFLQGRVDYHLGANHQFFARYTADDANQFLPTDYPQFPRTFLSRNQFFTGEYRRILSARTLNTARVGFSRTRIGQNVEANTRQTLAPFITGRDLMGDIDIGGVKRFGPQSSGNLRLVQNVFSLQSDLVHSGGATP